MTLAGSSNLHSIFKPRALRYYNEFLVSNQVSQEELAKAQQKHASVNLEEEVELRTRMDDLHRELNEVKVGLFSNITAVKTKLGYHKAIYSLSPHNSPKTNFKPRLNN